MPIYRVPEVGWILQDQEEACGWKEGVLQGVWSGGVVEEWKESRGGCFGL